MVKIIIIISTCIYFVFIPLSLAQNVDLAIIKHSQKSHFEYDPNIIKSSQIKSIKKNVHFKLKDSLDKGKTLEYHLFNIEGMPIFVKYGGINNELNRIEFQYDSLNQLVKKTIFKPFPYHREKRRADDIYTWTYEKRVLIKTTRHYVPSRLKNSKCPKKYMVQLIDTFLYNKQDSSVSLLTSYSNPLNNKQFKYHTIYKFHSNNNIKEKAIIRNNKTNKKLFDTCGLEKRTHKNTLRNILKNYISLSNYFPLKLQLMESRLIDTVIKKNNALIIHYPSNGFFINKTNTDKITINTSSAHSFIYIEKNGSFIRHNSRGSFVYKFKHLYYYNRELMLTSEETCSSSTDNERFYIKQKKADVITTPKRTMSYCQKHFYTYYKNGLLEIKCKFNSKNTFINIIHYKMEFY